LCTEAHKRISCVVEKVSLISDTKSLISLLIDSSAHVFGVILLNESQHEESLLMMYFGDELPEDEVHMEGELDDEDEEKRQRKKRMEKR
jgi:hypothetical protein